MGGELKKKREQSPPAAPPKTDRHADMCISLNPTREEEDQYITYLT